uniref:ATP synthase F0 subunit 8 n=1 Tax=Fushitsunagia catenata TaxID=1827018 RepID=UPI0026E38333|nr:ATP synthase F0 subunit 8 [Fushitsunagia catenata]WJJ67934.1 ATP synthase F0 subunit 8 [Fushitsunagia catenata]
MPQLDLTIIFSQIFWLFVLFFVTYTILIHFFLPKFLFSIKSRKKIIEFNSKKTLSYQRGIVEKQLNLHNLLLKSLNSIKEILTNNWSSLSKVETNSNAILADKKIGLFIFNMVKYCDYELMNSISLYPKKLNLISN